MELFWQIRQVREEAQMFVVIKKKKMYNYFLIHLPVRKCFEFVLMCCRWWQTVNGSEWKQNCQKFYFD